MSKQEEEFREQCIKIQSSTGMDDTAWKAYFGNKKGLYGFITSRDQAIREEAGKGARIDELTKLLVDMDSIGRLTNYSKIRQHTANRLATLHSTNPKSVKEQ